MVRGLGYAIADKPQGNAFEAPGQGLQDLTTVVADGLLGGARDRTRESRWHRKPERVSIRVDLHDGAGSVGRRAIRCGRGPAVVIQGLPRYTDADDRQCHSQK